MLIKAFKDISKETKASSKLYRSIKVGRDSSTMSPVLTCMEVKQAKAILAPLLNQPLHT